MMRHLCVFLLAAGALIAGENDWQLGTTQMNGYVGANAADGFTGTHPSIGTGATVGLWRFVALQGNYFYNIRHLQADRFWFGDYSGELRQRSAAHEFLGGPRIMLPIGRVTPYFDGLAGGVRQTYGATVELDGQQGNRHTGFWKAAFGGGAGAEIQFSRAGYISVGMRAVRPLDMGWTGALMIGLHYRVTRWKDPAWRM